MQTLIVVPARYGSTRLPGKPLLDRGHLLALLLLQQAMDAHQRPDEHRHGDQRQNRRRDDDGELGLARQDGQDGVLQQHQPNRGARGQAGQRPSDAGPAPPPRPAMALPPFRHSQGQPAGRNENWHQGQQADVASLCTG